MDKEPLEAKDVQHWTCDPDCCNLERSLDELRKSLGVPKVIEVERIKPDHRADDSKMAEEKKEGN